MSIDIRPTRTDADHTAALAEVDILWGAGSDTVEGAWLEILLTLIEAYE
jgi:HTH-type transcriptional regulator / antitoxin HigA